MKKKYYFLIASIIFVLLFFVFLKTAYVKYTFLGIAFFLCGIWARIDNIEHPSSENNKKMYPTGEYAWIVLIIGGLWMFFYSLFEMVKR